MKMVEGDSGDEGRSEGDHSSNQSHSLMVEKLQYQIWGIIGLSKCSYILSFVVTGHSCDRVMECSTRFYMVLCEKVLSNYPRPYVVILSHLQLLWVMMLSFL